MKNEKFKTEAVSYGHAFKPPTAIFLLSRHRSHREHRGENVRKGKTPNKKRNFPPY
jgi:hypothetical protein